MKSIAKLLSPYRGMRREIYIIFISRTINAMGALIYPFMTLLLSSKIGLSGAETGFYVTMIGVFFAPASLIGGKLSDHFGRKPVLIIAELLSIGAYVICIFLEPGMPMVYMLMTASFLFGIAGPSHDAMTADLTTPEQRQGAYSLSYLGFNLGFAFAQVLAGLLFRNHLNVMFIIDAGTALLGVSLIGFFIKETLPSGENNSDEKADNTIPDKKRSIFSILKGTPILIVFALAAFGYRFTYSQWSFLMPLHAEAAFPGGGAKLYGMLGSTNALIVVFATPVLTALFAKSSNIRRVFYAGLLFTAGFSLLGFITFRAAFFMAVSIFTLGEILEAVSTMPFIMNHTPETHRGRMSSVLPIIMGAGWAVGPMTMGQILDRTNFSFCWILAGGIVLVSTLGMKGIDMFLGKERDGDATRPERESA